MERFWIEKSWPLDISTKLEYKRGIIPLHEYLRANADEFPDKVSCIYYGKEITWKQFDQYSDSIANFLISKGIKKGDRVALFMQNCPQYIIAHFAVQKIGAIVGPVNPMFKEWELEYEINDLEAKAIFTTEDLYPIVENILEQTSLENVIVTNYRDFAADDSPIPFPEELTGVKNSFSGTHDMIELLKNFKPDVPNINVNVWEDVALMVYTSGTTGKPKGAMLTYGNALFKTASCYQANRMQPGDLSLITNPIFHIAGMIMGVNIPVYGGNPFVLLTRFEPEAVITAIEKYKCSTWYSIVPMNIAILKYPGIEQRDLTSLRTNSTTSFGTALTENISQEWSKVTNGCLLYEAAYGLSETHTFDTFMPWNKIRFGSCGIPVFDTDIRILDSESGKDLGSGEQGEIAVKNPGVFKGYWKKPEATEKTLQDGWVFTGDIGVIDKDGYLYLKGRLKEMIKCSGYSVFPDEVEELMLKHPAIEKVAVIGIADNVRGENVKAFVVLKEDYKEKITTEEIIKWAKNNMAAYKYPRYVEFRDSLPVTSTGKVLRRLLKEETQL